MSRTRPQSHAFVASACLLLAAVANRSLTGAAFLVAFGVWGAVVVATSGGSGGGAPEGLGPRGRWDARRLGHGLWAAVAALAAVVTASQVHLPCCRHRSPCSYHASFVNRQPVYKTASSAAPQISLQLEYEHPARQYQQLPSISGINLPNLPISMACAGAAASGVPRRQCAVG